MKIAVTGSSGFIGAHVVNLLTTLGHEFVGIEKTDGKGGILDTDMLREKLVGSDTIIHLAALNNKPFKELYETNVQGSWNVIEAARDAKVNRVVFASTYGVKMLRDDISITKAISETLTRGLARRYKVDFVGLRLHNIYGPGQHLKSGALIPAIIDCIKHGRSTGVSGSGLQTRDFVYVTDAAECLVKAALVPAEEAFRGLCFDIGTGWATRIITVVRALYDIAGKQPHVVFVKSQEEDSVKWSCGDPTMCRTRLDQQTFIPIREGLERLWTSVGGK